ncbi:zonular occludens toxin domain-containing protein [Agarivorans litoreus]|uniref:zonular occludens toxin domain-containing protein n=1 Tax=Agarivorans litoreus TaxID=1510455 RepID=UPI001C7D6B7D|nr:zonular occludens toxin domain-containing protein [Agarivorans litoreus]
MSVIILITGVPGSGKSLEAIKRLYAQSVINKDDSKAAQHRPIYADIDGCCIDGVETPPDDWRETPEGSIVTYDECQRLFPSTGKAGNSTDDKVIAMETIRHTGHTLILITQSPTFIHHHIRKLVTEHIHIERQFGLERCRQLTWSRCAIDPLDKRDRRDADVKQVSYDKKLYSLYKSSTKHTVKKRFPTKLKFILGLFVMLIASVAFLATQAVGFFVGETETVQAAPTTQTSSSGFIQTSSVELGTVAAKQETQPLVSGCISNDTFCTCYTYEGIPLDLDQMQCRNLAERPLMFKIPVSTSSTDA